MRSSSLEPLLSMSLSSAAVVVYVAAVGAEAEAEDDAEDVLLVPLLEFVARVVELEAAVVAEALTVDTTELALELSLLELEAAVHTCQKGKSTLGNQHTHLLLQSTSTLVNGHEPFTLL